MANQERSIELFIASNAKAPFEEWTRTVRDKASKARIYSRIDRLRLGNFGDCEPVGDGVFELRIHFGPGFRVYFGTVGVEVVLLLCGGDKGSQSRDIDSAIRYWKEYKIRANQKL
ncbi:MAG: type II toxin-antitoxin system RelE/ParE family toxin [Chloroflexi bacterium]|nr:type II toxin-antitoxin system RelE/ParE family toxin [Chloroflexota bacterium]